MRKVLSIARWEYITKVRTKAFLISIILMPVIIFAFAVLPTLLMEKADTKTKYFGIADLTGWVYDELNRRVQDEFKLPDGKPNYILKRIQTGAKDIALIKKVANRKVLDGEIEAYLIIPDNFEDSLRFQYIGENIGNIKDIERFRGVLESIVVERKLSRYGIDRDEAKKITKPVKYNTIRISKRGEEEKANFMSLFFSSYIFIIALMILVITGGQMLIRSVIEEKSNRVVELLVSSCTSNQLMAGKIIGLGLVGLTQMLIWGAIGFSIFSRFAVTMIDMEVFILSFVYFILGYLFYAAFFVAVGAPVNSEYEAQQVAGYVSMALVFPIVFAFLIMQNPDSPLIKILSFIPVFTPAFMVARLPIKMPPVWEIAGTITLLILSVIGMIWVAGRIFRIAILSYGKFPNLQELLAWIKSK
jgi:ABC-2 type transport system permease protein